jgi:hypothetical protein
MWRRAAGNGRLHSLNRVGCSDVGMHCMNRRYGVALHMSMVCGVLPLLMRCVSVRCLESAMQQTGQRLSQA